MYLLNHPDLSERGLFRAYRCTKVLRTTQVLTMTAIHAAPARALS